MNRIFSFRVAGKMAVLCAALAVSGMLTLSSCEKKQAGSDKQTTSVCYGSDDNNGASGSVGKGAGHQTLSSIATVAGFRTIEGSSAVEVFFNENTEFFTVTDAATIATLKTAFSNNSALRITFDPWQGVLVKVATPSASDEAAIKSRVNVSGASGAFAVDFTKMTDDVINEPAGMGILNTTDPGLNNLIPDFATAQLMFDYITRQCCELPGPYAIDYCIPFQYCIDGCYARAHKMCWIINNRYKYGTKKIFSFANAGSDKLCVQGQKWGGCCIRWWYHVAPLVTIKTPTGPKAYVFDPAMFNQPVLLATWLHAQENPACAGSFNPHVTMINVQPTTSYAPSGSSGMSFSTDPMYTATNNTLDNYSALITCP